MSDLKQYIGKYIKIVKLPPGSGRILGEVFLIVGISPSGRHFVSNNSDMLSFTNVSKGYYKIIKSPRETKVRYGKV